MRYDLEIVSRLEWRHFTIDIGHLVYELSFGHLHRHTQQSDCSTRSLEWSVGVQRELDVCDICRARRACSVQLELSNDYQPETEYQGVLTHPHTTVLDGGAIGHTTLLPYSSDVPDNVFLQSDDWLQLPYGSCRGLHDSHPPPPQRSPASCVRSRPPAVTVCGLEARPTPSYSPLPPPASPAVGGPSSSTVIAAVTSTPTIKPGGYARHNSLSSSFSNLI